MLRILFSVLLPLSLGLPFSVWLQSWLTRLAMAFLTGMVIITAGLIAVGSAGLGFGFRGILPIAILWLAASAVAIKRTWASVQWHVSWPSQWRWPAWVLLAVTASNVAAAAAYALRTPVANTDVVKIWLPKAELLVSSGFTSLAHSVYPDYPPLWPIHMYLAGAGGTWLKLLPSAYLLAILAIVFDYVSVRSGPALGAACALTVSGVPYIWLPYGVNDLMSEVPTTAYVVASTIMLAEYVDHPSGARAALTAVAAIGAVWVRPEGFLHALLIAALLVGASFLKHRLTETLLPAAAIVLAYLAWRLVVRVVFDYSGGLQPNPGLLTPMGVLSSLGDTIYYAAANVGNPYLFGPALIASACVAFGIARWRSFGVVGLVLMVDLAVGVATYVALPSTNVGEPLTWWLTTGFKRMVMHLIPLLYAAAFLAIGAVARLSAKSTQPAALSPCEWRNTVVSVAAVTAVTILAIATAGYAEFRVGGPKSFDLSDMGPSLVSGSSAVITYPGPGVMSVTTTTGDPTMVTFNLLVTGRRLPPLDNITGTFTAFSSSVEADGPDSAPEHFTVNADGKVIGEATANPGGGPVSIDASIPLGTRLLELSVQPQGSRTATASWSHPTIYRLTGWWAVEVLLIAALSLVAAWSFASTGMLRTRGAALASRLKPQWALIVLVAAGAVQQIEATMAIALPAWSYAARLLLSF